MKSLLKIFLIATLFVLVANEAKATCWSSLTGINGIPRRECTPEYPCGWTYFCDEYDTVISRDLDMSQEPQDEEFSDDPLNNAACTADPVYLHNGQLFYQCNDLQVPGRVVDLGISHLYSSGMSFNGPFGYGWMLNYYMRLHHLRSGNVVIVSGDGRKTEYTLSNGVYSPPAGRFETLQDNGDETFTLTLANGAQYHFDSDGKLASINDRNSNIITFIYDASGEKEHFSRSKFGQDPLTSILVGLDYRLVQIADTNGRIIQLQYNGLGLLQHIVDGAGSRQLTFNYDPETNDLVSVTKPETDEYPDGVTKTFEYEDHNIKRIQDPKGQYFVENFYDNDGRVYEQNLGGSSFLFDYSVDGETTVTDRKGIDTTYVFNGSGNVISETVFTAGLRGDDPISFETTYTYNDDSLKTSVTYPKGNGIKFVYDELMAGGTQDTRARGNLLEIRKKADMSAEDNNTNDHVVTLSYESLFNLPKTVTDALTRTTTYLYDYELDSGDPRYGENGNLVTTIYPTVAKGTPQVDLWYNAFGQVVQKQDANANITTFDYFPDTGYLKEIIRDPNGINAKTQYTYDANGYPDTVTDAKDYVYDYDYNALGWLVQEKSPSLYLTKYFHDANGNVQRIERQADEGATQWQVTTMTYDILNNLKIMIDPMSHVTQYFYDNNENLESVVDAESNTTTYTYDERNKLFQVTDANTPQGVTQYDYDINGNLKRIIDAKLNETQYDYDLFDQLRQEAFEDGRYNEYTYDKNGNLDIHTLPDGKTIDHDYDELNRLIAKTYPSTPSLNASFDYDLGSRLEDADNASSAIHFGYDALDRLQDATQTLANGASALHYTYYANGQPKSVEYPSGKLIEYTYDPDNRADLIKVNGATLVDYDHDALSRLDKRDYPLISSTSDYTFDMAGHLTSVINTSGGAPLSQYDYPVYDNVGNRKQMDKTLGNNPAESTMYGYNDIYELTSVTGAQTHTYDYDALGNREVADGITYTPNALNQYDDVDLTAFDYDNNGNLTSDGSSTFGYNEENQLVSASGVLTSSYQYDALGRRVSKTVGGIPTYFVYDGDQVVEERDNAGTLIRDYLYGLGIDEVLTMTDHLSLTTYHYFYDGLGSVTEISDSAGAIQEYYVYDPYGNVEIFDASGISLGQSSVVGNRYMFTGQEFDEESGLHHYNARTYNPTIGRFHQRDPLGYYDSLNLFQYVGNNPTNFIDPWGEDTYYINNKFKSSKPTNEDVLSHSFVAITDIDPITGKEIVTKTFSWVNVNNGSWENVYNQQNKLGAQESINTGIGATKVGYSDLDPYIEKVFKTIKNQTGGYSLTGNSCHTEALDLIEEARFQLKINKIINGN